MRLNATQSRRPLDFSSPQLWLISLLKKLIMRLDARSGNGDNPENQRDWQEVDSIEIKAFVERCLYAGLHKSKHESMST